MRILVGIAVAVGAVIVVLVLAFLIRIFFYHEYVIHIDPPDMPGFSFMYKCWGKPSQEKIDWMIEFEKIEHRAILFGMTPEEREEANRQALERLREKRLAGKDRFIEVFPRDGKKEGMQ